MIQRTSGILLHPTSLSNPYLIGDLGPGATAFVNFLVESGQRCWEMLPIGPTGHENSPYQSPSAFAGNPLLISPDWLMEQDLLDHEDVELVTSAGAGKVNYAAAIAWKLRCLHGAFERFEQGRQGDRESEFEAFARAECFWLDDFSLFSAIEAKQGSGDWTRWNVELRERQPDSLARARKYLANDIRYHQFVQWQFALQWKRLRAYCSSKGICLIGDIPLFVAHRSADVWAHRELFKLDADGNPTVIAGVPPDYFSPTGQLWGLPVYRWEALQRESYRWWIERLRTGFARFDVNRLDHFIGFVRTYEVPMESRTAVNGQYQPAGGASLFKAAREALGVLPFIADDLGDTTAEVVALLNHLQIPGTRVLQFEYESSLGTNPALAGLHPAKSVVYTGTHDNDTTAGWYRRLPIAQREALQKKLGASDGEIVWSMIREAFASPSETALVPAQDLLELGSEARMNLPGTAKGNWEWRLQKGALTPALAQTLRNVTARYGRLSAGKPGARPECQDDVLLSQIAKRAYELYRRRGRLDGQAVQDWLRAEQEIKSEIER